MKSGLANLRKKAGMPPGALVYTGNGSGLSTRVRLLQYNSQEYYLYQDEPVETLLQKTRPDCVNWLIINGMSDPGLIEQVGNHFRLHPLLLEDVFDSQHLPKSEDYLDYLFVTLKILDTNDKGDKFGQEHVSLVLGRDHLISITEGEGGLLDEIARRIAAGAGKARDKGPDYLMYRLIDIIVDHYFDVLEKMESGIEDLESLLVRRPYERTPARILEKKKQLIFLKRNIYPLREELRKMSAEDSPLIQPGTLNYFKDIYDHLLHIIQVMETFREMLAGLMELHMSNISNMMNSIMKTLTLIGTIFIPLTFIVGVYGMNFKYMPELEMRWTYPVLMAFMLLLGTGMYFYMKRKKWF